MSNTRSALRGVPLVLCRHRRSVCSECITIEDAARRICDVYNATLNHYIQENIAHCWMSFTLQDGRSDGRLYGSKLDAVRHVPNEHRYLFLCFRNALGGVNPRDMQIYLNMCRAVELSPGVKFAQPDSRDGGPQPIVPADMYDHLMGRLRGTRGPFWT